MQFNEIGHVLHINTRGDQKVRGKVLLYLIAIIDCNENSLIKNYHS